VGGTEFGSTRHQPKPITRGSSSYAAKLLSVLCRQPFLGAFWCSEHPFYFRRYGAQTLWDQRPCNVHLRDVATQPCIADTSGLQSCSNINLCLDASSTVAPLPDDTYYYVTLLCCWRTTVPALVQRIKADNRPQPKQRHRSRLPLCSCHQVRWERHLEVHWVPLPSQLPWLVSGNWRFGDLSGAASFRSNDYSTDAVLKDVIALLFPVGEAGEVEDDFKRSYVHLPSFSYR
jgi:hypothetical protein